MPRRCSQLAGLPPSDRILNSYPHQLSGGERQRVSIAQALACRPALVIADEPFTALDSVRVVQLGALFRELRDRIGSSFLVISHTPGVLARIADSVLVMQHGRMVEQGPPARVFGAPAHPYTAAVLGGGKSGGCVLTRCCGSTGSRNPSVRGRPFATSVYDRSGRRARRGGDVRESGKSTLARCIARMERPDSGEIRIEGRAEYTASDVQLIFQEAAATLNPRFTAAEILEEPLLIQKRGSAASRAGKARQWLEMVGLPKTAAENVPWPSAAASASAWRLPAP